MVGIATEPPLSGAGNQKDQFGLTTDLFIRVYSCLLLRHLRFASSWLKTFFHRRIEDDVTTVS
jgi:hypothetical protein